MHSYKRVGRPLNIFLMGARAQLWRLISVTLAGTIFFHVFCLSEKPPNYTFMHQATTAPKVSYHDYIIIGGGTAGCPLAATLSQNSTVLLLERGDSPYNNPNITNIANFGSYFFDPSPKSPSQLFVSTDGVINARARVLGGGSAINAGFFSRAEPGFGRNYGWEEKLVNESFQWVEEVVVSKPPMGKWQTAVKDGLLEAGVGPDNGFTVDHLSGTKFGGTIFDKNGYRHTSADLLEYADPNGIKVFLHASVHKILFKAKGKLKPMAYGVVFKDALRQKHKAYLKEGPNNEIIVSAGAIGSPQLLLLSGLGPRDQLKAHKISVILDQGFIGQGMADNPMNGIFVPSPIPTGISLVEAVGITKFGSYIETASGINFVAGTDTTHGGLIFQKITGPLSKGYMELQNRNPNDNPSVTFNYYKHPQDMQKCVEGMKTIERVIESKALSSFRFSNFTVHNLRNFTSNMRLNMRPRHRDVSTSLEHYCNDTVSSLWHYHGGCQVGRVIDYNYKVIGVNSLRVIDGSTFNSTPGTNPQATLMMLGRYMGVKILNERFAGKGFKEGSSLHVCRGE